MPDIADIDRRSVDLFDWYLVEGRDRAGLLLRLTI